MFPHHCCDASQFGRGHRARPGQAGVEAKSISSRGSRVFSEFVLAQSLPPHPCPLPGGEGEPFVSLQSVERATPTQRPAAVLPLPDGEGWGEGEGSAVPQINWWRYQDAPVQKLLRTVSRNNNFCSFALFLSFSFVLPHFVF